MAKVKLRAVEVVNYEFEYLYNKPGKDWKVRCSARWDSSKHTEFRTLVCAQSVLHLNCRRYKLNSYTLLYLCEQQVMPSPKLLFFNYMLTARKDLVDYTPTVEAFAESLQDIVTMRNLVGRPVGTHEFIGLFFEAFDV